MDLFGLLGPAASPLGRLAGLLSGGAAGGSTLPYQAMPAPALPAGTDPAAALDARRYTPPASNAGARQPLTQGGPLSPDAVVQGLVQRGIPLIAAQGIATRLRAESGLDPSINERAPVVPGSRGGYGLAQWTGPRRRQLESFAAERGRSVDDPNLQMDFLVWEMQNTEAGNSRDTLAASTPEDAAREFMLDFLRPGITHADMRGGGSVANASSGGLTGRVSTSNAPQGLLSTPPEPERRPSLWDKLEGRPGLGWLADPDRRARLALALDGMTLNPNQGLQETLRGDLDASHQSQERQRMAAQLAQMPGGEQYAAMIAAGFDPGGVGNAYLTSQAPQGPTGTDDMQEYAYAQSQGYTGTFQDWQTQGSGASGPETWQTLTPEQAAQMGLPDGGVYQQGSTGQIRTATPAPDGKGGADLGDVGTFQTTYRNDPAVKRMEGAATAYGTLQAAAQSNNPSDNLAFVYAYMKMLDPGSVVRETEAGMVAESGSIDQRILNQLNGFLNGETMRPEQKQQFLATAQRIYQDAEAAYAPVYDYYSGLAGDYMLPEGQGPIDYRREWAPIQFETQADAPPAGGAAPAPATTQAPPAAPASNASAPTAPHGAPSVDPAKVPTMSAVEIDRIMDAYEAAEVPIPPRIYNMLRDRLQSLAMEGN